MRYILILAFFFFLWGWLLFAEGYMSSQKETYLTRGKLTWFILPLYSLFLCTLSLSFCLLNNGNLTASVGGIVLISLGGLLIFEDVRWQILAEPIYIPFGLIGALYSPFGGDTHTHIAIATVAFSGFWCLRFLQILFHYQPFMASADIALIALSLMWLRLDQVSSYLLGVSLAIFAFKFLLKKADDGHQALAPALILPLFALLCLNIIGVL